MRGTPLRRVGLMLLAVVVTTLGMTTPARAADTGVITGMITYNGSPVPNASVYATGYDTLHGGGADTDGTGRYTISDLPPGRYHVEISVAGHPNQYAPSTTSWTGAQLYAVTVGGTTTADATLIPYGTVTGRLATSTGAGAAYASVFVESISDPDASDWTTADENGTYTLPVPVGEYTVQFLHGTSIQYAYGKRERWEAETFPVALEQFVTVDDTLPPKGSAGGTVLTAAGQPAVGVSVYFDLISGGGFGSAATDSAGRYRIDDLAPGQYTVSFRLSGGTAVMYHPHVLSAGDAQPVTIAADQVTEVDETLFATGAITGRLTRTNGTTGVANAVVAAHLHPDDGIYGRTDPDGSYRIQPVFAGNYRVNFSGYDTAEFDQWATGKHSYATANAFTVAPNAVATVNDKLLGTGSVRVTAKDAVTGAAVPAFSAQVRGRYGETVSGAVTLTDVPAGVHPVQVRAQGYQASEGVVSVTVTPGQQSAAAVTLNRAASVQGKVVNAAGTPVAGVCVVPIRLERYELPEGCLHSSDANGNYRVEMPHGAGSYRLFAIPDRAGPYGAQWVGPTGGTGDPRQAAVITAADGQWVTAPTVKLDRQGTVTGIVTSETGQPVAHGSVGVYTHPNPGCGCSYHVVGIDGSGRYTTDFLGPYQWALVFAADGHATQWSGGATNRSTAQTVKVTSDAVTTYHYTMKVGSLIQGTVTLPDGSGADDRFHVSHSATGELVAYADAVDGVYQLRVLTPMPVTLRFGYSDGEEYHDLRLTSRLYLRGDTTFHFCISEGPRLEICGARLPRAPRTQDTPLPSPPSTGPPRRPAPTGDRPADRL
ncbi:carboxypeptidase-like regulatory domain-containing protein [Catellatospora sp. NPDC049609]|uniref:carboxypeptidase-like regulatory domain-containing protein n=1 Tax=Catellatospora sp. NPDC049609 TaxID=3155505 RepID=UPI003447E5C0